MRISLGRIRAIAAGAAVSVLLMASSASAACMSISFVDSGCFSTFNLAAPFPTLTTGLTNNPGYATLQSTGTASPVLSLTSDQIFNTITLSFAATTFPSSAIGNLFTLTLQGTNGSIFAAIAGSASASTSFQNVTFFSSLGIGVGDTLLITAFGQASSANPVYAEIGHIVVAPAPLAGAGLFSFFGLGFAGLLRRSRAFVARVVTSRKAVSLA